MDYDKRKAWENGKRPAAEILPLALAIGPAGLRGRVICVALPRDTRHERALLDLGFYWSGRRACWAHSGDYRAGLEPTAKPKPIAVKAQGPTFDRERIARIMRESNEAAGMIAAAMNL